MSVGLLASCGGPDVLGHSTRFVRALNERTALGKLLSRSFVVLCLFITVAFVGFPPVDRARGDAARTGAWCAPGARGGPGELAFFPSSPPFRRFLIFSLGFHWPASQSTQRVPGLSAAPAYAGGGAWTRCRRWGWDRALEELTVLYALRTLGVSPPVAAARDLVSPRRLHDGAVLALIVVVVWVEMAMVVRDERCIHA
ncbi:hypothetical protein C8J57DRAFT_1539534 [Mycena rebaudengoi]|nr:hypothetical protein C8J57DRAFT_1539534 [Mycena rebaudengoi]